MPAYTTKYSTETPATINRGSELPEYITEGKAALDERYSLEHESLIADAGDTIVSQARHTPGKVSCVLVSSTAPSDVTAGTLWYDSANSKLKIYSGTAWSYVLDKDAPVSLENYLALQRNTTTTVSGATVTWQSTAVNIGNCVTTLKFTTPVRGVYLISCSFLVEYVHFEYKPSNIPSADPFSPVPVTAITQISVNVSGTQYPICRMSLNYQDGIRTYYSSTYGTTYTIPAGCRKNGSCQGSIAIPITRSSVEFTFIIRNRYSAETMNSNLQSCVGSGVCWVNYALLRTLV